MKNQGEPGLISKVADLKAYMLKFPTLDLGFLCPECFVSVRCSTVEQGLKACWCDCYSRVFEPEKFARLTLDGEVWLRYIKASPNYQFAQGLNRLGADPRDLPIINALPYANYDIWCPGCGRNRKMAGKGTWLTKTSKYVCTYGVCGDCMSLQEKASEEEATKRADLVSDRLLARYPALGQELEGEE